MSVYFVLIYRHIQFSESGMLRECHDTYSKVYYSIFIHEMVFCSVSNQKVIDGVVRQLLTYIFIILHVLSYC